jgi:hypothetical protein
MDMPGIQEWLELSEPERSRRLASLNAYAAEDEALLKEIADRFRHEYAHLRGVQITGLGVYHGGSWVIGVSHPFVFDRRLLPQYYLGVPVKTGVSMPLPEEFQGQEFPHAYVWAPKNFERFVDRCADQVRREFGRPDMTREEMLHALIGVPFEKHVADCQRWAEQGVIPRSEW